MSLVDEVTILDKSVSIPGASQAKRKKEKNFSIAEDVHVCSAWIHTSQDSVKGKDRTDTQFWNRAVHEYNKVRKDYPARMASSLKNRWSKIQKDVRKFIAILDNLKSLHPSGCGDKDLEKKALDIFSSDNNGPFKYYKCWEELRDITKFNGDRIVHDDFYAVNETQVPQVNLAHDDGSSSPTIERPIGRKAAKEGDNRKRKTIDMLDLTQQFEQSQTQTKKLHDERKIIMEEQGQRAYDLALKSYELQERMFQAKEQSANDNAMSIDLAQMTGSSKTYWELRQQGILAKLLASNNNIG